MEKNPMPSLDAVAQFGLFVRPGFFDERLCPEIVAGMHSGGGGPATIYGQSASSSVNERVRKSVQHTPPPAIIQTVQQRLWECKSEVEAHFGLNLHECEAPQFLRYRVGDFFVAHQDGNTGLLRLDQEARRVSLVIFLSRQSDAPQEGAYCGGSLVFHDWRSHQGSGEVPQAREPGTLVAFRAETTHEVTPITHGERLSIACWFR